MARRIGWWAPGLLAAVAGRCAARIEYVSMAQPPRALFVRAPAQVETFVICARVSSIAQRDRQTIASQLSTLPT